MIYVAMFDEVDEATAIFKCAQNPPSGDDAKFVGHEGLPSDFYLKVTGQAGKLLRDESGAEFPAAAPDAMPSNCDSAYLLRSGNAPSNSQSIRATASTTSD
jgi:hypothetical protein